MPTTRSPRKVTLLEMLRTLRLLALLIPSKPQKRYAKATLTTRVAKAFKGTRHDLSVQEVLEKVLRTGWQTRSKNPRALVRSVLAKNSVLFRRVSRGTYRLKTRSLELHTPPKRLLAANR